MTTACIRNFAFLTGLAVLGCGASGGSPPAVDASAGVSNPPDAPVAADIAVSKPDVAADVAVVMIDAAVVETGMADRPAVDSPAIDTAARGEKTRPAVAMVGASTRNPLILRHCPGQAREISPPSRSPSHRPCPRR